jgi:toxin ParE1/3/4
MKLKMVFHEEALTDLEEIWLYTFETWSLEQADRYYGLLINEIEFLAKKPTAGKSINSIREGYHSTKVKSHIIFYRFSSAELNIIRILHESMDIPNHL